MADTITKILYIEVNYDKAMSSIVSYQKKVQECKDTQADLRKELQQAKDELAEQEKQLQEGTITQEQYNQALDHYAEKEEILQHRLVETRAQQKLYAEAVAKNEKVIQNQLRAENAQDQSLVQLRAELSNLTAQYDSLSEEERKSASGKELQDHINEITSKLKGAEEETQRYYRNVGNYENAIKDAFSSLSKEVQKAQEEYKKAVDTFGEASEEAKIAGQHLEGAQWVMDEFSGSAKNMTNAVFSFIPGGQVLAKLLPLIGSGAGGVKTAFNLAAQGAKTLGKQLLALMANPIVAFLAIVAAAIASVSSAIQGNEDNMNTWNRIMAPLSRGLAVLSNALQVVVGWMLNVVEASGKVINVLVNIVDYLTLGIFHGIIEDARNAIDEANELANAEQKLAKDRRAYQVEEAKEQLEIAKLKKEATDESNKDYKAREKAAQEAADKELKLMEERKRMAQEELRIAKQRAEWSGNSAADNEELAKLEAEVYKTEKEYFEKTKELQSQVNSIRKKAADEEKKQKEEKKKLIADQHKKENEAIRAHEDTLLKLIKDNAERQRQQILNQYSREIADLEYKLKHEEHLTAKAKEEIRATILAKQQEQAKAVADLELQISADEINRQKEVLDLKLQAIKKNSEEEYGLKLQQIELNKQADLLAAEQSITDAEQLAERKQLIEAAYAEQSRQAEIERNNTIREEQMQEAQNGFEERMQAAVNNSLELAQIELEQRQFELENLHQMEEESDASFKARLLAAQKNYNDSKKKLADQEIAVQEAKAKAQKTISDSLVKMLDAVGEDNEAFAKLSKMITLGQIAVDTGRALSSGIANAMAVPYPANLVAVATTVGTVMTNIASAISTVKSAKFARGVIDLQGSGTSTSDAIPANLSRGESVMTAKATNKFGGLLSIMNDVATKPNYTLPTIYNESQQVAANQESTENIKAAVSEIRPVVSVEEISEVKNRVETIQNLDSL